MPRQQQKDFLLGLVIHSYHARGDSSSFNLINLQVFDQPQSAPSHRFSLYPKDPIVSELHG